MALYSVVAPPFKLIQPGRPHAGRRPALGVATARVRYVPKKKKTVFIVEVHLAIQASLQALHLNPKKQNKRNMIRIPTGGRQTSWLFTRTAEELNQALTQNNSS